jgi:hypothetical protein
MAPILATATGFTPQVLDDPALVDLLSKLKSLSLDNTEDTLPMVVELLRPWTARGHFQEQVRSIAYVPFHLIENKLTPIVLVRASLRRLISTNGCTP